MIDRIHNGTVAAGMLVQAGQEDAQALGAGISAADRAAQKHQKAQLLHIAGEGEAAEQQAWALEAALFARGHHAYRLGAGVYAQAAEVAAALLDAGLIVIATQAALPQAPAAWQGASIRVASGLSLAQTLALSQA